MELKTDITITLTPKEAQSILKEHFEKKYPEYKIDHIYFNVERVYSGEYGDDHGSMEVTKVVVSGAPRGMKTVG